MRRRTNRVQDHVQCPRVERLKLFGFRFDQSVTSRAPYARAAPAYLRRYRPPPHPLLFERGESSRGPSRTRVPGLVDQAERASPGIRERRFEGACQVGCPQRFGRRWARIGRKELRRPEDREWSRVVQSIACNRRHGRTIVRLVPLQTCRRKEGELLVES